MSIIRRYIIMVKYLLFNEFRNAKALFFSMLLPVAILVLIGSSNKSALPTYYPGVLCLAFGTMALVGVPAQLSGYREVGILKRVEITQLSLRSFIAVVFIDQIVFMLAQFIVITVLAVALFGLAFNVSDQYVGWVVLQTFVGMLAFLAIGLTIAAFSKNSRSASTIGNALLVTMLFVGGVFIPIDMLPDQLVRIVKYLPLNNLVEALGNTLISGSQTMSHMVFQLGSLAACFVVFILIGYMLLTHAITKNK